MIEQLVRGPWIGILAIALMAVIAIYSAIQLTKELVFYAKSDWNFHLQRYPANSFQIALHSKFSFLKIGHVKLLYHLSNLVMGMSVVIPTYRSLLNHSYVLMF